MKKKKAFILAYSVILMAFVMFLITAIFTMLHSSIQASRSVVEDFNRQTELAQLGEYFVRGDYWRLESDEYDVIWYAGSEDTMILEVRDIQSVQLYVEVQNGKVIRWIYGEKS